MTHALPLWRSILFVPVLNDKFLQGAPKRGADCIQLDLEDAIPPDQKDAARLKIAEAADSLVANGCDVIVRINRSYRLAVPDIEASVRGSVRALTLPKVPNAAHVQSIAEIVEEVEREQGLAIGHTRFVVMIETAQALAHMAEIAQASPRVVGVIVGAEDLAVSMGMDPTHQALLVPNVGAVAAARAAGCLPLGFVGSVAGYSDLEEYRTLIREARGLGFAGAFAIHPDQVDILNQEFSPSEDEIDHATQLVAAFEAALAQGRGAVSFGGKMIDLPVVERAKSVLAARDRIAEIAQSRSVGR